MKCIHCDGEDIRKSGVADNGKQKWYCKPCRRKFTEGREQVRMTEEVTFGFMLNIPWGIDTVKDTIGPCHQCGRIDNLGNGLCVSCHDAEIEHKFRHGKAISVSSKLVLVGSGAILDIY